MAHNQDSEWFSPSLHLPDMETIECSHNVIVYDNRTNRYYLGFYCKPQNKWIENNTGNDLFNISKWRYFKK